jgi:hypothetical protein
MSIFSYPFSWPIFSKQLYWLQVLLLRLRMEQTAQPRERPFADVIRRLNPSRDQQRSRTLRPRRRFAWIDHA